MQNRILLLGAFLQERSFVEIQRASLVRALELAGHPGMEILIESSWDAEEAVARLPSVLERHRPKVVVLAWAPQPHALVRTGAQLSESWRLGLQSSTEEDAWRNLAGDVSAGVEKARLEAGKRGAILVLALRPRTLGTSSVRGLVPLPLRVGFLSFSVSGRRIVEAFKAIDPAIINLPGAPSLVYWHDYMETPAESAELATRALLPAVLKSLSPRSTP